MDPKTLPTYKAEIETFFACHKIGSTAHTAVTLMLHTACARADVVRLGWQNVIGSRLQYRHKKTERFSSVVVDIPIHPDLQEVLDALPKEKMTFLETTGARSANGLGNSMRKWCNEAGLPAVPHTDCLRPVRPDWQKRVPLKERLWLGQAIPHPKWSRSTQAKPDVDYLPTKALRS